MEANPPRADGTVARVGTDKPLAAAKVREGTTVPELLPLLMTALLPPPFELLVPLLVPGTELAPPALCCGRLPDITLNRLETPQKPLLMLKASGQCGNLVTCAGWLASSLACVLSSWKNPYPNIQHIYTCMLMFASHLSLTVYEIKDKNTKAKTDNKTIPTAI